MNPNGEGPTLTPEQQAAHDKILAELTKQLDEQGKLIKQEGKAPEVIVVVLAGPAGTGKTTLMRNLIRSLRTKHVPTQLMAPTGKAASRLKQVTREETSTIHGAFFKGADIVGICTSCGKPSEALGILPAVAAQRRIPAVRCEHCGTTYRVPDGLVSIERKLKFREGDDDRPEVAVAIVDESSMISKKLYEDMMSRVPSGWRILFVGDKEQLQPVVKRGEPEGWGVNFDSPDVALTTVLRQAADNPIIQLATLIRMGEMGSSYWAIDPELVTPDPRLRVTRSPTWEPAVMDYIRHRLARRPDGEWDLNKHDVVMLTFMNAARRKLNGLIRSNFRVGRDGKSIAQVAEEAGTAFTRGDRLLITFNNHAMSLMNGEVYPVVSADYIDERAREWGLLRLKLRMYDGSEKVVFTRDQAVGMSPDMYDIALKENRDRYNELNYYVASILKAGPKERTDFLRSIDPDQLWRVGRCVQPWKLIQCDYGDCISIVKSQGSQWKNVIIVWDETTQWLMDKKYGEGDEYGRRLAYTALTRAAETAHIYLVAQRKPYDPIEDLEEKIRKNKVPMPPWMYEKTYPTDQYGNYQAEDEPMNVARQLVGRR
jgi:ATP-dependent exoDNAse (exonuclease V) alpha subunit